MRIRVSGITGLILALVIAGIGGIVYWQATKSANQAASQANQIIKQAQSQIASVQSSAASASASTPSASTPSASTPSAGTASGGGISMSTATGAVQTALGVTLTTQPLPGVSGVTGYASNLTSVATDGQVVEVFSFNSSSIPPSVLASLPKISIPTAGGSGAVTFTHKNLYVIYVGVTKNQSSALKSAIDGL
jgi:cytoskeletal protein RodZ